MKIRNKKDMILNGNMYKTLILLSIPIMINNLIQTLYNLADGIWVSKLGSVQFAATSFVWPVNFFVYFHRIWTIHCWDLYIIPVIRRR